MASRDGKIVKRRAAAANRGKGCDTTMKFFLLLLSIATIAARAEDRTAFDFNARLGGGVNLGNWLEPPTEGGWGTKVTAEDFRTIAKAGFKHVRIPIRWSAHADKAAPFTMDSAWFARTDFAVSQALSNHLAVVLNMHDYDEILKDPATHRERYLALWKQIAEHYRALPDSAAFELLNEPNSKLDATNWNIFAAAALKVVRESNPQRIVVIGPTQWNSFDKLEALKLPEDDRRIVVTFHYYLPFHFTHQGADWAGSESKSWLGTKWTGSEKEMGDVRRDFDKAAAWGKAHDRPIYLGEFGAYSKGEMESRARWTRAIRDEAKARSFATAYWEFSSGFGVYDTQAHAWREPLLNALLGK